MSSQLYYDNVSNAVGGELSFDEHDTDNAVIIWTGNIIICTNTNSIFPYLKLY